MMKFFCSIVFAVIVSQCCLAQHWDSLPANPNQPARVFYTDTIANKLYVGGAFIQFDNQSIWGIASWNGSQWDSLGHGIDDPSIGSQPRNTEAITRLGGYLYVGGGFFLAGNQNIPSLARWDGSVWDSVPGAALALNKGVTGLTTFNNELYICGTFDTIGNVPVGGIARWDGVTCHAIGNYDFLYGGGVIWQMQFYRGNLYVSGAFTDPNGYTCRLAKWDGSNWQFFTNEIIVSIGGISDLEVYNDKLYVGGCFFTADGNVGTSIVTWNDTIWSAVGGSVQLGTVNPYPFVRQMCVHNGKLYCIGSFELVGGVSAKGLASWDGTQWCGYDAVFTSAANNFCGGLTMAFYNDTMYVG